MNAISYLDVDQGKGNPILKSVKDLLTQFRRQKNVVNGTSQAISSDPTVFDFEPIPIPLESSRINSTASEEDNG
jgi:hypothetical protein